MENGNEMAEITGETLSTIKYHIEKMKKNGIIERNGSSQSGNWKINNEKNVELKLMEIWMNDT